MRTLVLVGAGLLVAACASSPPASEPTGPQPAGASTAIREAYTRYRVIEIAGRDAGYLLSYEPLPLPGTVQRALPAGSHRIQNLDFEDVGFITPRGEVFRHTTPGESMSLGTASLDRGLARFFSVPAVKLRPLQP